MKRLFVFALVGLLLTGCHASSTSNDNSKTTSVRHVLPFNKIEARGTGDVIFVQGDTFGVKVVGSEKDVERVTTEFSGSTLIIKTKPVKRFAIFGNNSNSATVYVTSPDLVGITLRGTGDFTIAKELDTDTLSVDIQGVGDVNLNRVICDEARLSLQGVGDISMNELTAQKSKIDIQGTGDVRINFVNGGSAICNIAGVGDVTLSGNLKRIEKDIRGVGDVNTKRLKVGQ